MVYKTVYTEVEVDVDIEDFETDDLIEELENRDVFGFGNDDKDILNQIYRKRRLGIDYQKDLDELIYNVLGKIL